jgi:hypothetical protein
MASDQLTAAEVVIWAEAPNGDRRPVFKGVNEQTGPGGSPDGVQATVKDNELPFMPLNQFPIPSGWKIIPAVKLKVADGMDASDCVVNLPVRDQTGAQKYLSPSDLGLDTDLPAATPVGLYIDVGEGYTVPDGQTLFVGGGKYFISLENDTA